MASRGCSNAVCTNVVLQHYRDACQKPGVFSFRDHFVDSPGLGSPGFGRDSYESGQPAFAILGSPKAIFENIGGRKFFFAHSGGDFARTHFIEPHRSLLHNARNFKKGAHADVRRAAGQYLRYPCECFGFVFAQRVRGTFVSFGETKRFDVFQI
jgi:hypothetical protein